jgi:peptide/nickel transport system substrate-binding protein
MKKNIKALILVLCITLAANVVVSVFAAQPPIVTDTYWHGTIGQPRRVDPARAYDTASGELIFNVYEPLIRFKGESVSEFEPCLADSYTVSPDGLTWTFHIRENVKWHPWVDRNGVVHTGDLLTPLDVEYSFERGLVLDQYGSPMWMLYLPLLGEHNSDAWDLDENGKIEGAEEAALAAAIDNAITRDDAARTVTLHLNFPFPQTAFKQILAQTWGSIVHFEFCRDYGNWPGPDKTFEQRWDPGWAHFRRYPTNSYSPLDQKVPEAGSFPANRPAPPVMCGTGPYKFRYWDKSTLEWAADRFTDYWGGFPTQGRGPYIEHVYVKGIAEWSTRKMMFLAGEFDSCVVPRLNMFELLQAPDPTAEPLPGIVTIKDLPTLASDVIFFTCNINPDSPYVGTGKFPDGIPLDFFANTHVRKAFAYALDFDTVLKEGWYNEGIQPATWWVKGLAPDYEDKTIEKYALDLSKVEAELKAAMFTQGGVTKSLWEWGFTLTMLYNLGNDQRRLANALMIDAIQSLNAKRSGLPPFRIINLGIDWPVFLDAMEAMTMPVYQIGWLADFADADNWARPFMHSLGDYAYFQALDTDPNWDAAHVDELVERGITTPDGPEREAIYKELQRIYHDLVPSLPVVQPLGRRWQRDWVQGYYYNILGQGSLGNYFYIYWKAVAAAPKPVDVSAVGSITPVGGSIIKVTPRLARMKTLSIDFTVHRVDTNTEVPIITVFLALNRTGTDGKSVIIPETVEETMEQAHLRTLRVGESVTVHFTWNETAAAGVTAVMPPDNYTISGVVVILSSFAYDSDMSNNFVVAEGGPVIVVTLSADIDENGKVNIADVFAMAKAFGTTPEHRRWNPYADLNGDNKVNIGDVFIIAKQFGKTLEDP